MRINGLRFQISVLFTSVNCEFCVDPSVSNQERVSVLRVPFDLGLSVFLSLSSSVNSSFACSCLIVDFKACLPILV